MSTSILATATAHATPPLVKLHDKPPHERVRTLLELLRGYSTNATNQGVELLESSGTLTRAYARSRNPGVEGSSADVYGIALSRVHCSGLGILDVAKLIREAVSSALIEFDNVIESFGRRLLELEDATGPKKSVRRDGVTSARKRRTKRAKAPKTSGAAMESRTRARAARRGRK